jgi:hypothetical protein
MPALNDIPEVFNGISGRIIAKIILSSSSFQASSYFFPGYFFYLGFLSCFRVFIFILRPYSASSHNNLLRNAFIYRN